jgi:hypothetical protein
VIRRRIALVGLLCLPLAAAAATRPLKETAMTVDHVSAELAGEPCDAYFFARWSTYSHPVTPQEPLYLEQALLRKNFYRAWSCAVSGQPRFVLFEAIANQAQLLAGGVVSPDGAEGPLFFALAEGGSLGAPITAAQAMQSSRFGLRFERGPRGGIVVQQKVSFSYRYRYRADGRLDTVTITNNEGVVKQLQY